MGWLILVAIFWLVIFLVLAFQFEEVANKKGHYEKKYFWFALLFGVFGYLLIIALPDRKRSDSFEETKKIVYDLPEL